MSAAKNTALKAVTLDHPINQKIVTEWADLTPALAEKWLGRNLGNRKMKDRAVQQYARDMRNGRWETTGEAVKFDWNGRLIDGQNRCMAVIESGATIRVLVIKGLPPEVQGKLDQGVKRSGADALKFAGYEGNVSAIAAAARIAMARENGGLKQSTSVFLPTVSTGELQDWVAENPEITNAVALASRTYKQIGAQPAALAYCIFALEAIDGTDAVEFFMSASEFRTSGARDPRSTMLRTFNNLKLRHVTLTHAIQISLVFRAWNAWRAGRSLTTIPVTTTDKNGINIPEPK